MLAIGLRLNPSKATAWQLRLRAVIYTLVMLRLHATSSQKHLDLYVLSTDGSFIYAYTLIHLSLPTSVAIFFDILILIFGHFCHVRSGGVRPNCQGVGVGLAMHSDALAIERSRV